MTQSCTWLFPNGSTTEDSKRGKGEPSDSGSDWPNACSDMAEYKCWGSKGSSNAYLWNLPYSYFFYSQTQKSNSDDCKKSPNEIN